MTNCIIVDIDGTLADCTHRLHYISGQKRDYDAFFSNVKHDGLIKQTKTAINAFRDDYSVIIVSGRSDRCKDDTVAWLHDNGIAYDEIHMRRDGDHRQDSIVKEEILTDLLDRGYEVFCAVDDRPQVLAVWHKYGIFTFACPWHGDVKINKHSYGKLTLLVGPSGAGKSTYAKNKYKPSEVVSSDDIRDSLCGDFKDQSKNDEIFAALHALIKVRVENGLNTVVDATNIRNKDRLAIVDLVPNFVDVEYVVLDREMKFKIRDGGWRNDVVFKDGLTLLKKHDMTFKSNLNDILAGDGRSNVTVVDMRSYK